MNFYLKNVTFFFMLIFISSAVLAMPKVEPSINRTEENNISKRQKKQYETDPTTVPYGAIRSYSEAIDDSVETEVCNVDMDIAKGTDKNDLDMIDLLFGWLKSFLGLK